MTRPVSQAEKLLTACRSLHVKSLDCTKTGPESANSQAFDPCLSGTSVANGWDHEKPNDGPPPEPLLFCPGRRCSIDVRSMRDHQSRTPRQPGHVCCAVDLR